MIYPSSLKISALIEEQKLKNSNRIGITRWIICGLSVLTFNSCSHFVKEDRVYQISHQESDSSLLYKRLKKPYKSSYGKIPMDSHPDVDKWVHYFTGRGREYMKSYLERSSRYLPLMKSVLKESGLPENLVYVALIESGFSPKALSRANAVGYWQFIQGTGKRYGLRIDGFVDERRDPVLSTRAAANYFKDLYSLFGSWHLALAAYNSGEYRVNRAVLRHYNRNFWFLSTKKALPRETRNYIPKLIAAIHISKNPENYGFYNLQYETPINYELVKVKQPLSLLKLSKQIGVPLEEIKRLNPMYKGEYVPIYEEESFIRIPVGFLASAEAALPTSWMKRPKYSYHYHYWYRVRGGDSLYKIAHRHKTTVRKIRRANRLGNGSLIRIGQKLKIPSRQLIASKRPPAKRSLSSSSNTGSHTVKKGQSLSRIARLHGLKLSQLKKLNNIQGTPTIHPGQKLKIRERVPASEEKKNKYHVVRKGDTLIGIAKKHKTSLPQLMKANSLSFKSVLLTGTRLIIP